MHTITCWYRAGRSPRLALNIFLFASGVHLLAILGNLPQGAAWTKPILLLSLFVGFYAATRAETPFSRYILGGLLMSWVGDVMLMQVETKGELFFILGLGAFLLAHVFYASAFLRAATGDGWFRRTPWIILPFLAYLIAINGWWWNALGNLRAPVVLYSGVISFMAIAALNLRLRMAAAPYTWLVIGAILFLLSDSLIAVNKFKIGVPAASFLIMLTYILAQWFIASAALQHSLLTKQE